MAKSSIWQWLRRLFGGKPKLLPRVPTLTTLDVGDVLTYLDESFLINQKIVYHSKGFFWHEYQLESGTESAWLAVEEDDSLEVCLFRPIDLDLNAGRPKQVTWNDRTYKLVDSGSADATIFRESGQSSRTELQYWDWETTDGELLSLERWGDGDHQSMAGRRIPPGALTLMGSSRS
jgi:hypothetical protein